MLPYGRRAAAAADEDTDSDDDLGATGEYVGTKLRLRLQLSRWERAFAEQHGRSAHYEDKKLDAVYQRLRSELRAAELAWRAERQRELDDTFREGSTARSSSHGGRRSSCYAGRRGSIVEREKQEDLEQNKVIEAGYKIKVGLVEKAVHGVDTPEQLRHLNGMLKTKKGIYI